MFQFAREKGRKKNILKDENVSDVSILTEECLGSCHASWREDDEKGKGGQNGSDGQPRIQEGPQTAFLKEKTRENIGMCTIISPFSTVCRFKEGGAKSLKGQDNRKGYSFQLQSKPALCVDIVYTYQYIDICRASYLYIPITYIVYGTKVVLTGKRLPTVPGRFWWIWS